MSKRKATPKINPAKQAEDYKAWIAKLLADESEPIPDLERFLSPTTKSRRIKAMDKNLGKEYHARTINAAIKARKFLFRDVVITP